MKKIFTIYFALVFSLLSINAQEAVNLQKATKDALNFIVTSDMGRRGVSEQQNIANVMGNIALQNKIDFVAVAGDPIHDDGVKSTDYRKNP